jgi:hypothetical protein
MTPLLATAAAAVFALPGPINPHGTAPQDGTIVITSITAGETDPNGKVPTLNGVRGAGTNNWDIAIPTGILVNGRAYTYALTFQDIGYSGQCSASYKLTQGTGVNKVTLDQGSMLSTGCAAGYLYLTAAPGRVMPDAPGAATLTGTVVFGDQKVSVKVPMTIE